ncbi:MAG: ABC transporter permease [Meiothermus sp.]|nr:ABC transporter permease [Meiothermus sp.]
MTLAARNLFQNPTRLLLSLTGVALALMLILLLDGLVRGMQRQITVYLANTPGGVVVTQVGADNLATVNSLLPPGIEEEVQKVPGVGRVVPVLSQSVFFELHDKKIFAYLVGYDPAKGGGPWRLAQGREPRQSLEVVVDQTLARLHGVEVGEAIEVGGYRFRVVGLSAGTNSWMTTLVFVQKAELERYLLVPGLTSFLLVEPQAGVSPSVLKGRLDRLSGVAAWLKPELMAGDLRIYEGFFQPLRLMRGIAFAVGVLVVGMVVYTATLERRREYGVLKAIGASNPRLYGLVLAQALVTALLGTLLGAGAAYLVAGLVMRLRPQFLLVLDPSAILVALLSGVGMALLAAVAPAWVVARLAPAEVFRR